MPPAPYPPPSRTDAVVRAASRWIGGPAGRHLAIGTRGLAGVAAALVAIASVLMALGVWQKGHCLMKGWSNPSQFWRACYSDVPVVYVSTGLSAQQFPYASAAPSDQPLLSGLLLWALSLVSPEPGTGVPAQQWVFGLWAVLATLLLALAVVAGVALRPRGPWQVAHLAASPVLVVLALVSTDLLAVAMVMWALWAWQRRYAVPAGVLLGLAFLLRPYPLLFVAALAFVAWQEGRRATAVRTVLAAVLAALVVFVPLALAFPDGVLHAPRSWVASAPSYGALTMVPQLLVRPLLPEVATAVAFAGWVAALVLGAWLARGRLRPGVVPLTAVLLLVVALTAKALPVQAGLWLLPLLALSGVPWRDHLVWAGVEITYFVMVWMHIGFASDPGRGLPGSTYSLFLALRLAAWGWVVWRIWATDRPGSGSLRWRHGTSSSLPVVPPDSRSSWARRASSRA